LWEWLAIEKKEVAKGIQEAGTLEKEAASSRTSIAADEVLVNNY